MEMCPPENLLIFRQIIKSSSLLSVKEMIKTYLLRLVSALGE